MRRSLLALMMVLAAPAHAQDAISASYPEGPLYVGEALFYAEMGADRVMKRENGSVGAGVFFEERGCGPTAIAPYADGFALLCHRAGQVVSVDAQGKARARWTEDSQGRILMDPNDAAADGAGGVYFSDPGAFSTRAPAQGFVAYLSADGTLTSLVGALAYPNGVYVDRAGQMLYVSEHLAHRVLRFPILGAGRLGAPEEFADLKADVLPRARYRDEFPETGPDGLEIGPNGELYVAHYGAGRILRFSPEGAFVGQIETPMRYVDNIGFDAHGGAAVTGPFENRSAPYLGEVRFFSAARLTDAPH